MEETAKHKKLEQANSPNADKAALATEEEPMKITKLTQEKTTKKNSNCCTIF
jgi:hypothetical protein